MVKWKKLRTKPHMKTTQEVKLRQTNEATSWYNFLKAFPLWEIIKA